MSDPPILVQNLWNAPQFGAQRAADSPRLPIHARVVEAAAAAISAFAKSKSTRKVSHAMGVELRGPLRVHTPINEARAARIVYAHTTAFATNRYLNAPKSIHLTLTPLIV